MPRPGSKGLFAWPMGKAELPASRRHPVAHSIAIPQEVAAARISDLSKRDALGPLKQASEHALPTSTRSAGYCCKPFA